MASILVIDDHEDSLTAMADVLRAAGHQVRMARDGQEGITKYSAHAPDVIVTDIFMPEKDGLELIQTVRASGKKTRIIAVTGAIDNNYPRTAALLLGASRALEKPFDGEQLCAAVDAVMGTRMA